jgi:hypothetical protein
VESAGDGRERTSTADAVSPSATSAGNEGDLSRRGFLKIAGVSLSAVALPEFLSACGPDGKPEPGSMQAALAEAVGRNPELFVTLYRREDMVALTFGFISMHLDEGGANLIPVRTGLNADITTVPLIVVSHEPQHILERAYIEDAANSDPPPPQGPIPTHVAGRSRVAYVVPDGVTSIPFTVEDLLAVARDYELVVGLNATPPDAPNTRRIGTGGLALTSLLGSGFLVNSLGQQPPTVAGANAIDTTIGTNGGGDVISTASTPSLIQLVRSTRGLRTTAFATGVDVGFAPAAGAVQIPPVIQPTVPRKPAASETMLELPFRLEVSPNAQAQWAHSISPVSGSDTRYELWHSRLATRGLDGKPFEGSSYLNAIRALWSRDSQMDAFAPQNYDDPPVNDPFVASLRPRDRVRIVHQSSNFTLKDALGHTIKPQPVTVNRLMLTALGGYMDVKGDWGDNPKLGLAQWEHRATLARDHFVKIVETGYLYPFGHRAVLITISERKLKVEHPHVAYVRKRMFLVVKQPSLDYVAGRNLADAQSKLRQLPFTNIHIKTLMSPSLDGVPATSDPPTKVGTDVFPALVAGVPFRFACEALDPEGRLVSFTAPVVWVQGNLNDPVTSARFSAAQSAYAAYGDALACDFHGQRVAFAESSKPDDTTYETHSITFTAEQLVASEAASAGYQSSFVPEIAETSLAVEAARQLAGAGAKTNFSYHQRFIDSGFSPSGNAGEILFGLAASGTPIAMNFSSASDKSGGFITPNLSLSGLSRKIGPAAGDLNDLADNNFDPSKFFAGLDAKLFGVIDLFSIIDDIIPGGIESKAPKFITQALDIVEGFIQDATALADDATKTLGAAADVVTAISQAIADIAPDPSKLAALPADLAALNTALGNLASAPFPADMNQGLKQDIVRRAQQLQSVIAKLMPPPPPALGPIDLFLQAAEMAKDMRVHLEWRPPLKAFSLTGDEVNDPLFEPKDPANALILTAELRAKDLPGKPAGVDLIASLEKFSVYLIGKQHSFLEIPFDHIRFSILAGKKPDVDVVFGDMVWGGVLAFVKTLMDIIPSSGFSDPPSLTVDETGISASFSVALPNLAIGCFSLQNISLGAGFKVPFIGDPLSISFNFCTRENPFLLTVMMIGGGGYFGITLDPKGVKILEAQFEAGAELALDFGVASGSVSVMVGVYFKMEGSDVTLQAFFKIHGEVEVLGGIISAALTLELDLTYESATGKLVGTASMEIEVHVLFFSVGVTVTCSKKLAGSSGDPTFADTMRPSLAPEPAYSPWDEYVTAFAA